MNGRGVISGVRRRWGFSSLTLHVFAMAFMLCDHLWGTFFMHISILSYIGRLTFPIYAFLLTEGFRHTSSRKNYCLRLLLFAIISEVPFDLMMMRTVFYPLHQNVMWSLLLGVLMMSLFERICRKRSLLIRILLCAAATVLFFLLGTVTFVDFYGYGLLITALFYFTGKLSEKDHRAAKVLSAALQLIGLIWISSELIAGLVIPVSLLRFSFEMHVQTFSVLSLPIIWLYNGKLGIKNKFTKYFCYGFYPAHLLILGLLISAA